MQAKNALLLILFYKYKTKWKKKNSKSVLLIYTIKKRFVREK
jgi:hypothetical protein